MNNQRQIAKITGYSLVMMALIAGFSLGFAYPKFYESTQINLVQGDLIENLEHYKMMLLGIILIIMLDIFVSWTLYLYFKNNNRKFALYSSIFRIIYTIIFCVATYFLISNIGQIDIQVIIKNYQLFEYTWSIGLIIFGIHLLIVGLLMKSHKSIPRILWFLTILAGIAYILVHTLKTILPELTELTRILNNTLLLPMVLGELGLAIWLIVKGGQIEEQKMISH